MLNTSLKEIPSKINEIFFILNKNLKFNFVVKGELLKYA